MKVPARWFAPGCDSWRSTLMNILRARRDRLIAPYIGFVFLLFSCGAAAGTGQAQSQLGWLLALLVVCALPILVLNISLHREIRRAEPAAGSSGLKQTLVSSLLFTPLEAALVLPAVNLTIATRILRRGDRPSGKTARKLQPGGHPDLHSQDKAP
jgi:hypothetical protein